MPIEMNSTPEEQLKQILATKEAMARCSLKNIIPYKGDLKWLRRRTIFFARHGSMAYGTNIEGSDEDFKGICIPPKDKLHGYLGRFEQAEGKDPDMTIFGIQKFMQLAADCNPSMIEILWGDPLVITAAGKKLVDNRAKFLSRRAKARFSGYAKGQLQRIKTHYRWMKNPPKAPPTRTEMGLPERTVIPADQLMAAQSSVEKKMAEWNFDFVRTDDPAGQISLRAEIRDALAEVTALSGMELHTLAAGSIGLSENFIRLLDLERAYNSRRKEWALYQNWLATRNPARAALEEKFGYDTKNNMHLVRLMRMAREILTDGTVLVMRPDAEELKAIRAGAWTYEESVEWAEKEDASLNELVKVSPLPMHPDHEVLEKLCVELIWESL